MNGELPPEAVEARAAVEPAVIVRPRSRLGSAWAGWPGRVARVLMAVLPLVWLSRKVHWDDVGRRAYEVGPRGLALALTASFCSLAIGSLRWRVMLRAYGADRAKTPRWSTLLRYTMVALYFGVLPTGMAGEALRGWRVADAVPGGAPASYVLLLVERIAGLVGLLAIAAAAALVSPALRGGPVAYAMDAGVGIALVLGSLVFALPQIATRSPRVRRAVARIPVVGGLLARLPASRGLAGPLVAIVLSIASQACSVLSIAALIGPIAPTATPGVCARVAPAIILVTYIPLTPGGLGQREAAFVKFFSMVHVDPAAATAASLLTFAVGLILAFTGGLVLLYERARGLR